ncbi:MAG: OmpA family protein [Pseudomonadota bacterium]
MSGPKFDDTTPGPPRRLFLAAGLAAVAAGGAAALGILGQVSAPGTDSFRFARGTSLATGEEDRLRGFLQRAAQDDRIVVIITGHSGTSGDAAANLALSEDRAAIAAELAADMGVAASQIRAAGAGGGAPLTQQGDESDRAWQARLARVDVTLQVRR